MCDQQASDQPARMQKHNKQHLISAIVFILPQSVICLNSYTNVIILAILCSYVDWFGHGLVANMEDSPEDLKLSSCSNHLSMEFILLINVQIPIIVGIVALISRISTI